MPGLAEASEVETDPTQSTVPWSGNSSSRTDPSVSLLLARLGMRDAAPCEPNHAGHVYKARSVRLASFRIDVPLLSPRSTDEYAPVPPGPRQQQPCTARSTWPTGTHLAST